MNATTQITQEVLKTESSALVESVNNFTKELPKSDISELALRLKTSVNGMTTYLESSFSGTRKIDKIRSWIKLSIALKECRDTLDLIAKLKYANTNDLMLKVDNFNQMLIARHQSQ